MAAVQTLDQVTKQENRLVAGWLLHVDEREKAYLKRRENAISAPSNWPDLTGGGRGNTTSDSTAERANRGYSVEIEAWIALVREVEQLLPAKMRIYLLLRRKYRSCIGRRGWVERMQREYAEAMEKLTGKDVEFFWVDSKTTFKVWWDRVVEYAARLAAKRNLLP